MNTIYKDRRFTIARTDRPTARLYHLPVRTADRPRTTLALRWSLDGATGRPTARWIRVGEEITDPVDRRMARGLIARLSAALRLAA